MTEDPVGLLRRAAPEALEPHPVRFAYLFGSHAVGEPRPDSDLDVGALLTDTVPVDEHERIGFRCADAIAAATGLGGIQLTVLNGAPLRFLGRVLRQRIVLYSRDEPGRVAYESLIGRMSDDVECWAAPLDRELLAATAQGAALSMVDPLRVRTLLDRLGTELDALQRLAGRDPQVLLADEDVLAGVKYRFIVAIESCIDIGRHLIASERLRAAADYADVFTVLAEGGIVPAELAVDLRDVARFRNLLVHGYARVDDRRVVEILRTRLDDLRTFRTAIAAAVERDGDTRD